MSETILVVDDEPPIVDLLVYNLEQAHYRVLVARDGAEALAVARRTGTRRRRLRGQAVQRA